MTATPPPPQGQWFDLRGDERLTQRCATEGCGAGPMYRLEADGVGSNYCSNCRAKIDFQVRDSLGKQVAKEWQK